MDTLNWIVNAQLSAKNFHNPGIHSGLLPNSILRPAQMAAPQTAQDVGNDGKQELFSNDGPA